MRTYFTMNIRAKNTYFFMLYFTEVSHIGNVNDNYLSQQSI